MWNLCCCCLDQNQRPGERAPLMGPARSTSLISLQPGGDSPRKKATTADKSMELLVGDGFGSTLTIAAIHMKRVKVQLVDKRFQDHATLYNTYVEQWDAFVQVTLELQIMFEEHNPSRSLEGALTHLSQRCESSPSVCLTRPRQNCVEIVYNGREVPHDIIRAFFAYNSAGRSVSELLDKGPPLRAALRLVIESGKDLRRDVLVASLAADLPECLKSCEENIELLQETAIPAVAEIERMTLLILKKLEKFGYKQSADIS